LSLLLDRLQPQRIALIEQLFQILPGLPHGCIKPPLTLPELCCCRLPWRPLPETSRFAQTPNTASDNAKWTLDSTDMMFSLCNEEIRLIARRKRLA